MPRKIFTDGMVLPSQDVNSIAYPVPDGQDLIGHGEKIIDNWLSDDVNHIKNRFYTWYNRFRVVPFGGLSVTVSPGVINNQGTLISIPQQTLVLENNTTNYIYIGAATGDATIAVRRVASPVAFNHIPLAYITTSSGAIVTINDLRSINAEYIAPEREQLVNPGDVIFSLMVGQVPNGYLELNGQNVSRLTYSKLWVALGSPNTGDGSTTFTLPSVNDLLVRLSLTPGQITGNNSFTIGTNNLPAHAHQIDSQTHTHTINQLPHSHGVNQLPHSHTVVDGQHSHVLPGFVYDAEASEGSDGSGSAYLPKGSSTFLSGSNISIQPSNVNVSVNESTIGLSVNASNANISTTRSTGNSEAISISPRSISMRAFIKF